ncbi:MAG: hypothetical protein Q8P68_02875 [Candidatus Peregrinibacteria bacterium]|nr:hypothetical protein [Candidatus Peregrinibacteria bacterium]MDZ4245254.1 hypothetical protein [Candidatus Gracilibacteria bacterium]
MELVSMLYIVLIAAIIILTVLLAFVLIYVLFILRDVNKITETTKDTAEKINTFVLKPVMLTRELVKHAKPIIEAIEDRMASSAKKKSSTKSSKSKK